MTPGPPDRSPFVPGSPGAGRPSLDGQDDDLLDVIYEIAIASLDQVISLARSDFLS